MDMYQKRKMRQEKKKTNQNESEKISINWEITTYGKLPRKVYK